MRPLILALALTVAQRPATFFTTPLTLPEMQNKQAVVETGLGSIEIRTITIRDKPPPEPEPFSTETVQQLSMFRATVETSLATFRSSSFLTRRPIMCAIS